MKTQFLSRYHGWLVLIMLASNSFAQTAEGVKDPLPVITTEVNEKLNKAFQRYFKDVQEPRWYESNKEYVVRFIMNEQENMALLAKNGRLIWQITYGEEKHLPYELRKLVKSTYFDYNITTIQKVFEDNRTIWVINMMDNESLVIVRIEEGEMEEVNRYKKA